MEELGSFLKREILRDGPVRVESLIICCEQLVHGSVARKHAPVDAEGINEKEHKGADGVLSPVRVGNSEARDLRCDVRLGSKPSHSLFPPLDRFRAAIAGHCGVSQNQVRGGEFRSELSGCPRLPLK